MHESSAKEYKQIKVQTWVSVVFLQWWP